MLSSLLQLMKTFGKSESAIRMALSRTVKAGILINKNDGREVKYSLDTSGKEAIHTWNEEMRQFWKRYTLRNKLWNNKWYFINLEFGEEDKENRSTILEKGKMDLESWGLIRGLVLILYLSVTINAMVFGNPFHLVTFGALSIFTLVILLRGKVDGLNLKKGPNTIIALIYNNWVLVS